MRVLLFLFPFFLFAEDTLTITGGVARLAISDASRTASDFAGTYSIQAEGNRKIVGFINRETPKNTCLKVALKAPKGASSQGLVNLETAPRDLVTHLSPGIYANLPITLEFSASFKAGVVPSTNRDITFVLVPP